MDGRIHHGFRQDDEDGVDMKSVLITFSLTPDNCRDYLNASTCYRPDLTHKSEFYWRQEFSHGRLRAVVFLSKDFHKVRILANKNDCLFIMIDDSDTAGQFGLQEKTFPGELYICKSHGAEAEAEAFNYIEYHSTLHIIKNVGSDNNVTIISKRQSVALIGTGIVNLVTGFNLQKKGYHVSFFDKSPDPAEVSNSERFGATFSGGNARIFSFNESRHHLAKSLIHDENIYPQFRNVIGDGGWLFTRNPPPAEKDIRWIERQQSVPPWMASVYDKDIVSFNIRSHDFWLDLFSTSPQLLCNISLNSSLVRIYQTPESYARGLAYEKRIGSFRKVLAPDDLCSAVPALSDAVSSGAVHGAAEVTGFSLQVKTLALNLINEMKSSGADFFWESEMQAVHKDEAGCIHSVIVNDREILADNYVVSTGSSSQAIDGMEKIQDQIASVAGAWLEIPDPHLSLTRPVKVSRRHFACNDAAEGANLIPGLNDRAEPVIFCSSGHGFLGQGHRDISAEQLRTLSRCVFETAKDLFPSHVQRAGMTDPSRLEFYHCTRPWTSSGLGIFDSMPTSRQGRFVVTGGHNTGGFAQSPAVAEAVYKCLNNRYTEMSALYSPLRGDLLGHYGNSV